VKGVGYDVFGNYKYNHDAEDQIVEFEQMGEEASVLHDCSDQCILARVNGEWEFEHAVDPHFVLNSFSFCRNHGDQFDDVDGEEEVGE
jgi:hypothetical protein